MNPSGFYWFIYLRLKDDSLHFDMLGMGGVKSDCDSGGEAVAKFDLYTYGSKKTYK
jgi:hypothetical protein